MISIGRFKITLPIFGSFRLDGGSMFGSVPKNIWSRVINSDAENCIPLVTRSLLIVDDQAKRSFLVDTGMGEKWTEKLRGIYAINNNPATEVGINPSSLTDVILTHLHFDHAGGISYFDSNGALALTYPSAKIHLQRANYENAKHPTLKERASYLPENVEPLAAGDLQLYDGDAEIYPGIFVHRVDGHTTGQQWIEIRDGEQKIFFPTDLIPTSHHVPVPFHMGYDICAGTILKEKEQFGRRAVDENALVVFQHDAKVACALLNLNERGQFVAVPQAYGGSQR